MKLKAASDKLSQDLIGEFKVGGCRGAKLGPFGFSAFFPQFCSVLGGEK